MICDEEESHENLFVLVKVVTSCVQHAPNPTGKVMFGHSWFMVAGSCRRSYLVAKCAVGVHLVAFWLSANEVVSELVTSSVMSHVSHE